MTSMRPLHLLVALVGSVLASASAQADRDDDGDEDRGGREFSEFAVAGIIVEQNATDGDTEIVISALPDSDKGLRSFKVRSPYGKRVLAVTAPPSTMGLREFAFETPEPPGEAILAAFPEGTYTFSGRATDGERFRGTAELSHELPDHAVILFPMSDQEVPADSLTIQWSQVPDAAEFILEFENESSDPEQTLTLDLPSDVTSFDVPPSLLVPGADYQVGIGTVAENGNIVFVEVEFSTGE